MCDMSSVCVCVCVCVLYMCDMSSVCVCVVSALLDALVTPLQERTEEWKRNVVQLDKDHAKGGALHRQHSRISHQYTIE